MTPPPDKSISHRAVFFCSIAKGKSRVRNFLSADDPMSSVNAFRSMGIAVNTEKDGLIISGKGLHGLSEPKNVIDCGNSGTTMRLLTGLLSGNPFMSILNGDKSLRQRPMSRVIEPCTEMGAYIRARDRNRFPPIAIIGKPLFPLNYRMPVASAQLKSALILAALYAEGTSQITECAPSRDHTERMLPSFGATISAENLRISIKGIPELHAQEIDIPGDFSSAAFFIAAGLTVRNAEVLIRNCGINKTRTGLIDVITAMGGYIKTENIRTVSGEPVADIVCRYSPDLKAVTVSGEDIPLLIDEFPVLTLLATQAEGKTEIRNAGELRVKESDRIRAMAENLRALGAEIKEFDDGMEIMGKTPLKGTRVSSFGDHRIAMAMAVAGLIADGETVIEGTSSVRISFPDFFDILEKLRK
ncbi:3-phosphoshikimate 1-carboxyvinyltransferase 1 [bacterium BMS3Abin07]|nr:3-phosphoshikimate 1-carboxyvinyltransferase 1 [bacterium BMS3Abin07]GBE32507.1 3-phosphoshikimate 1-carboxyvinyltransferase 1 [bacterium BMS3Bbin05]